MTSLLHPSPLANSVAPPTDTINVLLSNPRDRHLLTSYLRELGYSTTSEPPPTEPDEYSSPYCLVVVDAAAAQKYGAALPALKWQAETFLPLLVLLSKNDSSTHWLESGFDDVLRMPLTKAELKARLMVFLRLREQTERARGEREKHFRALIEHSADGIALLDLEGNILYASASCERILGYEAEEMIGRNVLTLVHPDDLTYTMGQALKAVQTPDEPLFFEHRLRHKDGSWRWIEAVDHNLLDEPAVGAIVVNFRDVTERKLVEQERGRLLTTLQERVKELRLLHRVNELLHEKQLSVVTTLTQLVSMLPGGWQFQEVAAVRLEVDGKQYQTENYEPSPWKQHSSFTTSQRETVVMEVVYLEQRWNEGEAPFLEEEWALFTTITDLLHGYLDRRHTESRLRFHAQLLNQVGQAVIANNRDGAITYWNRAAEKLYGWEAGEVLGRHVLDVTLAQFTREEAVQILKKLRAGESWTGELTVRHRDGHTFPALVTDAPVRDAQGNFTGVVGISTDISVQKETERQIRFQAQLLDSVRESLVAGDMDGNVLYWGPGAERLYGYSAEETIGKSVRDLIPTDEAHRAARSADARETGRRRSEEIRQRRDGSTFWGDVTLSPVLDEKGQPVGHISLTRDITERVQRERELEAVAHISSGLRAATTTGEMLPVILEQAIELMEAAGAALATCDRATGVVTFESARGTAAHLEGRTLAAGAGISARVIESRQPFISSNILDVEGAAWPPPAGDSPATVAAPLIAQDEVVGILWINRTQPFSEADVRLLTMIGNIVANALIRAQLFDERVERAEQLARINELGRTLTTTLDLGVLFERVQESIFSLFADISTLLISFYDPAGQQLTAAYAFHDGEGQDVSDLPPLSLKSPGIGSQSEVIHTRVPFIVEDLDRYHKRDPESVQAGGGETHTKSALLAPMLAKDEVLGLLQLQSYTASRFTEADAGLLSIIANTTAAAIHNARLFSQTQQRLHRLAALHTIDQAITGSFDLGVVLNVFLQQATTQLEVDAADVLLLNRNTIRLKQAASRGFRSPLPDLMTFRLGEGVAGQVALDRQAREIPDLTSLGVQWKRDSMLKRESFVFGVLVPLVAKGQVQGVLEVFHRTPLTTDDEWRGFLTTLATQAAIAIDNASLFGELQRSNLQLTQAYDATIEGLSRALDLRDEETVGHSVRVTDMTLELAQAMGLPEAELVDIRRGALLHDIGKMGVPDAILLKPGKLSEEEWVIMRYHPRFAYEMLAPISFLRPALDIPYAHHEKWDGSGYPRGLQGEKIPLAARIFAVVDVYDALTSDRPYRPAWSQEKTLAHIKEQTGKHFDPDVVKVFLRMVEG